MDYKDLETDLLLENSQVKKGAGVENECGFLSYAVITAHFKLFPSNFSLGFCTFSNTKHVHN